MKDGNTTNSGILRIMVTKPIEEELLLEKCFSCEKGQKLLISFHYPIIGSWFSFPFTHKMENETDFVSITMITTQPPSSLYATHCRELLNLLTNQMTASPVFKHMVSSQSFPCSFKTQVLNVSCSSEILRTRLSWNWHEMRHETIYFVWKRLSEQGNLRSKQFSNKIKLRSIQLICSYTSNKQLMPIACMTCMFLCKYAHIRAWELHYLPLQFILNTMFELWMKFKAPMQIALAFCLTLCLVGVPDIQQKNDNLRAIQPPWHTQALFNNVLSYTEFLHTQDSHPFQNMGSPSTATLQTFCSVAFHENKDGTVMEQPRELLTEQCISWDCNVFHGSTNLSHLEEFADL